MASRSMEEKVILEETNPIIRFLRPPINTFIKYRFYWLMVLPGLIFYLVFAYLPMYGIQIAFRDYTFQKGIWGSDWVGFEIFSDLFRTKDFWVAFRNTITISMGRLIFVFPMPILFALLLNEVASQKGKQFFQTVYTFPHFISWIVAFGIFFSFLSTDGIINKILQDYDLKGLAFFTNPKLFLPLIFVTDIWKTMGWGTIIYLAAIAGLNPEIFEAAMVDGANRYQKILHIVLPGIFPVITIMFILAIGNTMNAGFDQIFNMYSPNVLRVSDIIDTYVYRMSFKGSGNFSMSTAAGLFKSVINLLLLLSADRIVRRFGQQGIWR